MSSSTISVARSHRSIRRFTQEQVSPVLLDELLLAAQQSSSSSNMQSWSVVKLQDRDRILQLANVAGNYKTMEQCAVYLVWLADLTSLALLTDTEALMHTEAFMLGVVDCTIVAQTFALCAESVGLGVVYHGSVRYIAQKVREELNLPRYVFPIYGMAVGYPSAEDPAIQPQTPVPKLPLAAKVHEGVYNLVSVQTLQQYADVLDQHHTQHQVQNKPKVLDWIEYMKQRTTTGGASWIVSSDKSGWIQPQMKLR